MKKTLILLPIVVCCLLATVCSCKNGETYAEQKNKEYKAIQSFLDRDIVVRDEDGTVVCNVGKITPISEEDFINQDCTTDLEKNNHNYREKLLLYTAVQTGENAVPRVRFSMRQISRLDMTLVDGHYVLKGEEFGDDKKGWALVQVIGERCSTQTIVTRCTLYQQYMTKEAQEKSAKSYGGLTGTTILSPR